MSDKMSIPTLPNGQPVNFGFGNKGNNSNGKSNQKKKSNNNNNNNSSNSNSTSSKKKSLNHNSTNNIKESNGNHRRHKSNNADSNQNNKSKKQNNVRSKDTNNNSSNPNRSSQDNGNVSSGSNNSNGPLKSDESGSYAGSSFHVSQPKLSDLPKPSFGSKPAPNSGSSSHSHAESGAPVGAVKVTFDQLLGTTSNSNNNLPQVTHQQLHSHTQQHQPPIANYSHHQHQHQNQHYQNYHPAQIALPPGAAPGAAIPVGFPQFNSTYPPSPAPRTNVVPPVGFYPAPPPPPHQYYQPPLPYPAPQTAGHQLVYQLPNHAVGPQIPAGIPNGGYFPNGNSCNYSPVSTHGVVANTASPVNANQDIASELKRQLNI